MEDLEADQIFAQLLKNDEEPPFEDYWHEGFGQQVAENLRDDEVAALALRSFERLHHCLAGGFVAGLLKGRLRILAPQALFEVLERCKDLTAAANIVDCMYQHCAAQPDDIVCELLGRLNRSHSSEVQNRLTYGLWWLFNGETYDIESRRTYGYLVNPVDDKIEWLLKNVELSKYARESLEECRSRS